MNLPMVSPPLDWKAGPEKEASTLGRGRAPSVSDLPGGYFYPITAELALRYRLLTSKDYEHFYAYLNSIPRYEKFCTTITRLQRVPNTVNRQVFKAIMESMDELVAGGLLMPPFLATIKSHKAFRDAIKAELISDKYKARSVSLLLCA
jgi:hypothetical protein